jgi:imidazolonepropionase-like amidohydrolase
MGLVDVGVLEPGSRADFVVVDADPTAPETSVVNEGVVRATYLRGAA